MEELHLAYILIGSIIDCLFLKEKEGEIVVLLVSSYCYRQMITTFSQLGPWERSTMPGNVTQIGCLYIIHQTVWHHL